MWPAVHDYLAGDQVLVADGSNSPDSVPDKVLLVEEREESWVGELMGILSQSFITADLQTKSASIRKGFEDASVTFSGEACHTLLGSYHSEAYGKMHTLSICRLHMTVFKDPG